VELVEVAFEIRMLANFFNMSLEHGGMRRDRETRKEEGQQNSCE
jgi:hypothetical protein